MEEERSVDKNGHSSDLRASRASEKPMSTAIKNLIANARVAQGVRLHTPVGLDEPTHAIPTSQIRNIFLDLTEPVPNIAAFFDSKGKLRRIPSGRTNFSQGTIDPLSVARASSRLAAAGAHLILRPAALPPQNGGQSGIVVFQREVSGFSIVQPLKLSAVADEADSPSVTELPVKSASVDWTDETRAPAYGIQLEIPRNDYRDRLHDGTLDEVLTAAILAGAGRIADQALMDALAAASLPDFSLAAAASSGLAFHELRAIVGTAGAGAAVGQDGVLRASGISAELTDTGAQTFIGAFDHAAVILDRDIRVIAEKTGKAGALAITVYAAAAPLLPDKAKFWKVAA